MKRLILTMMAGLLLSSSAFGWGREGHETIAKIADNNLKPSARKVIEKYLGDHSIVYYAKWMDEYRHTPEYAFTTKWHVARVDENLEYSPYPEAGDAVSGINGAIELLKDYKNLPDSTVAVNIKYLLHLVGDMHCPMHIVYHPDNEVKGHFFVEWKGKKHDMHVIWDGTLWDAYYKWSFLDMAYLVDTATPEEIALITDGNIYDYASRSARDSWPAVSAYKEGDVLPRSYATDMRPLLFSQLRNGGYRLAAIFNEIFK
jgi:hypothetical protein